MDLDPIQAELKKGEIGPEELRRLQAELAELLAEKRRRLETNRFKQYAYAYSPDFVSPYKDTLGQRDGYRRHRLAICSTKKVTALLGGNRVGKTKAAAFWITCHATGEYPEWWTGKRFYEPTEGWTAGVTARDTRDIMQRELLGEITNMGTGMIPRDKIVSIRKLAGVPDGVDTIFVRHVSGGVSSIGLKSMEQGRSKFQGKSLHYAHIDEEPDKSGESYEIFSEMRTRTMTTGGQVLLTFTPLKGMNELCQYILNPENREFVDYVNVTWDDAPHLSAKDKEEMERQMLPHEVEARRLGKPVIREGLVFPFPESQIVCDTVNPLDHWWFIGGMDVSKFGGKTAALYICKNPQTGVWMVGGTYKASRRLREEHAREILKFGEGLLFKIDPAANQTEVDGTRTKQVYERLGLNLQNANNRLRGEGDGITALYEAFATGQLKIMRHCKDLLDEIRYYQFDNGDIKPNQEDHLIDCLRYAWQGREDARPLSYFRAYWRRIRGVSDYMRGSEDEYVPASPVGY